MSAGHLESKTGVRKIFWLHFQLLIQVFLSFCGSGGVVWADSCKKKKRDKNGGFFFHWVRARVLLLNSWLCRGQGRGLYAKTVA